MPNYQNLNKLKNFQALTKINPEVLSETLSSDRIKNYDIKIDGNNVHYNYATKQINEAHLKIFQNLSDEANLIEKYREIIDGNNINISENRKVLHHLTRGQLGTEVTENNENMRKFFDRELKRIFEFANQVQNGSIKSIKGKTFKNVVQVGIVAQVLVQKHYIQQLKIMLSRKTYI